MKKLDVRAWIWIAAGVCMAALAGLVARWAGSVSQLTLIELCAAIGSAALFAAVGVRFLFAWITDWHALRAGGEESGRRVAEPVSAADMVRVFFAGLGAVAAAQLLFYIWNIIIYEDTDLREAVEVWRALDTQHYLDIAREWYLSEGPVDRLVQLVFLPGYPIAIRAVNWLVRDELAAAMLVSAVSFSLACVLLYRLARLDMDRAAAVRTLKYTCLVPGAIFFCAPMSESLFLLLSVACVYCARRHIWPAAGVLGAMAAFTRSLGLVLAVPVCFELIEDTLRPRPEGWERTAVTRRVLAFLCVLIIPMGFFAYCLVCKSVSGNPFQFLTYQRGHWGQSLGFFFNTAAYQTLLAVDKLRSGDIPLGMGLWVPNVVCCAAALIVMAASARRVRPVYTAYFIVYYVVAIGTTWLLSAPRYLACLFPIGMGLASLTEDRRIDSAVTVVLAASFTVYMYLMAVRWQVW